jgi:transcriptional regulator with XRE-family HTH domain
MKDKKISDLFERLFVEFQAKQGHRVTLDDFAKYIGCSRPLVSFWLAGTRRPGPKYIRRLALLFGPKIYETFEEPSPNAILEYVNDNWNNLPSPVQAKIHDLVAYYLVSQTDIDLTKEEENATQNNPPQTSPPPHSQGP